MIVTTTKTISNNTVLIVHIAAIRDSKNSSKYNGSTKNSLC